MDLANIFSVSLLLVLLSISGVRSATVTLSKSAAKGQLGNNSLSLFCDYTLSVGDRILTIELKRKRANELDFLSVVAYYEDPLANASYYPYGSDLLGRTVATNPTPSNRRAILQFYAIQCADEADYRCELFYATSNQGNLKDYKDTSILVTATPTFGNQSLLYTPSTNLAENQTVTFICIGNVGREPQGTFSWYKYVGGQPPGMVITNGINSVSQTNVTGSCTYVKTENLTLNLAKEDNQMVIRCTVQQTTMTELGDGNIQTDRIIVYYAPRISNIVSVPIASDPFNPTYSEGLAGLNLTCNADSNPPSSYVWTLPDGTMQSGYQLRLPSLTTNLTGRYTCMAYTGWGGQNYTANNSINITVGVRSATVTLTKSHEKGQLGNNSLSLFCDYSLSTAESVLTIDLKRKRAADSSFYSVVSYYEDKLNASYYPHGSDLVGRIVLTNPTSANRRAILQFSSIQCTDEADYRCELFYAVSGQGNFIINSDIRIVVTATPMFGNRSLLYTPSANLAENQTVTFTCIGNVGREPQGTFSWHKYVGGQPPGLVITNGIHPVSLTNVAGSCTYVRTENLMLNLTKEDNQMVIRCTVHQTAMTEAGDGNIQTDRISVYYAPRINPIGSEPDLPTYSEGLAKLILTCNADSNPPSNYVWNLPDGTVQTGYQLRLTFLTTIHTGRYTCVTYTGWGGQNYTANKSINITVVETTSSHPISTTTTTLSSASLPGTKNPGTSINIDSTAQTANRENDSISSTLFAILFGVVLGVSVVLVTILSIWLYKQRMLATDLKHQLQHRSNTYDGLTTRVTEPNTALDVVPPEKCHQSANLNLYEGLHRTLESSEPYDILEGRL